MERLALIGVSYRRGGATALEHWQNHIQSTPHQQWVERGLREVVFLNTCNRCDVIASLPETMGVTEAKQLLAPSDAGRCYAYVGEGAVEQLSRIASSLDSLNPGEYQIMQQTREAFAEAEKEGTVGKDTRFAFTTAFRIAKRVRREVELAPLNTSLFSLAKPVLEQHIPENAHIGIVGMGEMGQIAARVLHERPDTTLHLVNRTRSRAETFAPQLQCPTQLHSLDEFLASPPPLHALVCATPASQIINEGVLQRLADVSVIVDLGIPRNVDSIAAKAHHILVLDVDTLQEAGKERRHKIEQNLIHAENILLEELDLAVEEWLERQLGPAIRKLREDYVAAIPPEIPEGQVQRLANRFSKVPIRGLRALARHHGIAAAKTFLDAIRNPDS
ncbi:MAG: glutamyl-tRNA reductase [Deltaproteobacteria bacterium]|nr:MAG: glutamyl-tRNA reductase [Deltaproteobacteria bacterium]